MKKEIVFLALGCSVISSQAQIAVGQWDVALPGKILYQAHDTLKVNNPGAINPGPSGANQTWNFSTLIAHTVDTMIFTNPNWLSNGSSFPNANLAVINSADASETYLRNDATGLFLEGAYGDPFGVGAMAVPFSDPEQLMKFTDTYNSTFTDTGVATGEFPISIAFLPTVDSARFKHTVIKNVKTDGWGNIITPLGTYPSLRHRAKVNTIDSLWLHDMSANAWFDVSGQFAPIQDSLWHFSWWTNGVGFALLEFDSTTADTIRNISWMNALPVIGGVSESVSVSSVSAFPNPSTGIIYIENSNEPISQIVVHNILGEEVYSSTNIKSNRVTVDFKQHSKGVYNIRVTSGKEVVNKKVVVQ